MKPETYQPYFMKSFFSLAPKRRTYKPKNKLSNDFDKLFFQFLIVIDYPLLFEYTKNEEVQMKYKISESLETFKCKQKKEIEHSLCYDESICLKTLDCLANMYKKNFIYTHMNIYYKMFYGEENIPSKVYVVTKDKDIYPCKQEQLHVICGEDKYEITNIHKPLYGIGHYKSDDLKSMINTLKLKTTESATKTVNYEKIKFYVNACLI